MLFYETVTPLLHEALIKLMDANELQQFRLVGGTSLSLQIGHRMSVDIDMFTYALHGSIDFKLIETYLRKEFRYVYTDNILPMGMGKSFVIGNSQDNVVKLDIFYSMDAFIRPVLSEEGIRLASIEDIIAMKIDVISRSGRKKDFLDLHELLKQYSINEMMEIYKERCSWIEIEEIDRIFNNFTEFDLADNDPDPVCLLQKQWPLIKDDFWECNFAPDLKLE